MIRRATFLIAAALATLALVGTAQAAEPPCAQTPKAKCFGLETLEAKLSTTQAGAHPDFTYSFGVKQDPSTTPDSKGLRNAFAPTRNVRFEAPPGLIGNPDVLGTPQQCTAVELSDEHCPNGSQIGIAELHLYTFNSVFHEPVYMMQAPGGEAVARIGFIAGAGIPVYADFTVRSDDDYGLSTEITDAAAEANLIKATATLWGVPSDPSHDNERCTPNEVFLGCQESLPRPPGSRPLPFLTNPTRCGTPLSFTVSAASWTEPQRFDSKSVTFPQITGCNKLPFGPSLTVEPTNHRASAPTGLDMTLRLPEAEGVDVLEPSQIRDIRIDLPPGLTINPGAADGQDVCSVEQVGFKRNEASHCPDAAKMASTEFEVEGLPRRMVGAIYLREPEPGNLFRVWVVADDLGAHVKLPGQLLVDQQTGQISSFLLDNPQVPLREVKLLFKSGFRAPLTNPSSCGTHETHYEFTPWSGGPPAVGTTAMRIDEGCGAAGFNPKLAAGTTDSAAGTHAPFVFTLTREDGEQNIGALDVALPKGLVATFSGIPRCEGAAALSGQCPPASRIGRVTAAVGSGPAPLWAPQPGKRPTAIYLGGPYKGGPLSIVAVVPAQAGPFDLGDQVVRSAVYVDPVSAQASAKSDPLPQILEGVPIKYRTLNVVLDRPGFSLNPTSCAQKATTATVTSSQGATASPSAPFAATDCAKLDFKPRISFRLFGGTKRGSHPQLKTILRPRAGQANIGGFSVALPHSEFLDQSHIKTVCTRVQFAADQCPAGAIYGEVKAITPLFEEPLSGPIYLRSSNNPLPDMVAVLKGPPSLPVEVHAAGRIDSVNGGIRATFEAVPDAPITEVIASFPGGKKGLLENSTNLCAKANKATAKFTGQNGRKATLNPVMQTSCKKTKKAKRHARQAR